MKTIYFAIAIMCICLLSCKKDNTEILEKKSGMPKQLITNEFASQLNQLYLEQRSKLIEDKIGRQDANAIWFSLEELENYIAYSKAQGKIQGYDVKGIRFYFGVYPEDYKEKEKAGLTTLFLSPTGIKSNQKAVIMFAPLMLQPQDIKSIKPDNYGGMGNPPAMTY